MEGDHSQTAALVQLGNGIAHDLLHRAQLVVDGDADGLEGTLGRMLLFPQGCGGHGGADHVHQLQGGFDGLQLPLPADGGGDLGRVALLAVVVKDPLQLLVGPGVHHIVGRQRIFVVHAHIQGCICHIGEASGTVIQLGGGNTQIQQDAVHTLDIQIIQHLLDLAEVGMDQGDLVRPGTKALTGGLQGHIVPVDADMAAGVQPLDNFRRMAGTAQGAIHINTVGLDV